MFWGGVGNFKVMLFVWYVLGLYDCRNLGFGIGVLNDEDALLLLGLLSIVKHGGYRCEIRLFWDYVVLCYMISFLVVFSLNSNCLFNYLW